MLFSSLFKKFRRLLRTGYGVTVANQYDDPVAYEALVRTFWGRGALGRHVADIFEKSLPVRQANGHTSKVLDLASGTGIIARELDKRGYSVWAGDKSAESLEYLRLQNPGITRVVCDFNKELPFEDSTFDGVTTVWANRYIKNEGLQIFLNEAYRVLIPGGVFIWPIFPADTILWKAHNGVGQITNATALCEVVKSKGYKEATVLNDLFYKNLFSFKLPPQTVPKYIIAKK
jgi:ubiquinone/menaquinone biosynthesis C-methylase UbiE